MCVCFNYITQIIRIHLHFSLIPKIEVSNTKSIMTKTELALRARTQVQTVDQDTERRSIDGTSQDESLYERVARGSGDRTG